VERRKPYVSAAFSCDYGQLGEIWANTIHIVRNDEVAGSTPVSSTIFSITYRHKNDGKQKFPSFSRHSSNFSVRLFVFFL